MEETESSSEFPIDSAPEKSLIGDIAFPKTAMPIYAEPSAITKPVYQLIPGPDGQFKAKSRALQSSNWQSAD